MIRFIKILLAAMAFLMLINACHKVGDLPYYAEGTATTLTSSAAAVTAIPADSNNAVVTFSWTDPAYAGKDSSNVKYVIELDSAGRNFMKAVQYTVTGSRSFSLTGSQLNNILVAWGFTLDAPTNVDVRIISSHSNNNEQLYSNILTIAMTPYALPFILTASDTTAPLIITILNKTSVIETFSWQSPGYTNATYTYAVQYDTAGAGFANAQTIATGLTDSTYSVIAGDLNTYATTAGIAFGTLGALDFRVVATINGRQTQASATQTIQVIPNDVSVSLLYVPGDYQGWNPPTAPPMASTDGINYDGYINITTTGGFKFTSDPDWNHTNYGDGGPGKLSTSGGNLNVPAAGYYRLQANTSALTWSAIATQWAIIGEAGNGWNPGDDINLTYDAVTNTWVLSSVSLNAGAFKFRANAGWDINLGGNPAKLTYGGDNLNVPEAGTYKVVLDLSNPAAYTYTLTRL